MARAARLEWPGRASMGDVFRSRLHVTKVTLLIEARAFRRGLLAFTEQAPPLLRRWSRTHEPRPRQLRPCDDHVTDCRALGAGPRVAQGAGNVGTGVGGLKRGTRPGPISPPRPAR